MHIKYRLFFFFLYFVSTSYIFEHTFYVLNRIIKIQNAFGSVPNPEQNRSNVRFDQSISINPRSRPSRAHLSREEKNGSTSNRRGLVSQMTYKFRATWPTARKSGRCEPIARRSVRNAKEIAGGNSAVAHPSVLVPRAVA